MLLCFFFFNDTATTEIYTLSLHDALPIWMRRAELSHHAGLSAEQLRASVLRNLQDLFAATCAEHELVLDRKSTRLNSSHANISYAVFCLKKKKNTSTIHTLLQILLVYTPI